MQTQVNVLLLISTPRVLGQGGAVATAGRVEPSPGA